MKRLGKHLSQVPHGRRLDEKAKEYARDPEILSLNQEIGLARALLEEEARKASRSLELLIPLLRLIGELVIRQSQLLEKKQYTIHVDLVQQQVQAVVNILYESLPEGQAEYLAELISHQVRVADRHGEPTDFPVKVRHRKRTEA